MTAIDSLVLSYELDFDTIENIVSIKLIHETVVCVCPDCR